MNAVLRHLIERFPRYQTIIDELTSANTAFDSLCREYGEVSEEIEQLESRADAMDMVAADAAKRRRVALEQELLAIMEQNVRV